MYLVSLSLRATIRQEQPLRRTGMVVSLFKLAPICDMLDAAPPTALPQKQGC